MASPIKDPKPDESPARMSRVGRWFDQRLPLTAFWRQHFSEYRVPRNLNIWYVFGSLALLVLVIQFVSGFFLTMHYKPDAAQAFESVQRIMREVPWGWMIRYIHTTGASLFFIVLYLHLYRGLLYGSYQKPRELVWFVGCLSFLGMMAEAFFGYLLPWGQMSYWGAQVITHLFETIPWVGATLADWVRGGRQIGDATLNRFFAFHVLGVPFVISLAVVLHLISLRRVGSNNPDGIDLIEASTAYGDESVVAQDVLPTETRTQTLPFAPFFLVKDVVAAGVFLIVLAAIVFYAPTMGGWFIESDNAVAANPLMTPADIRPIWYFAPFYAMLRATTGEFKWLCVALLAVLGLIRCVHRRHALRERLHYSMKTCLAAVLIAISDPALLGVAIMMGGVVIWFFLPSLDLSPVRSIRYRPRFQQVLYVLVAMAFIGLGVIGMQVVSPRMTRLSQICTALYYLFFLLMPWWSTRGRFRLEPSTLGACITCKTL